MTVKGLAAPLELLPDGVPLIQEKLKVAPTTVDVTAVALTPDRVGRPQSTIASARAEVSVNEMSIGKLMAHIHVRCTLAHAWYIGACLAHWRMLDPALARAGCWQNLILEQVQVSVENIISVWANYSNVNTDCVMYHCNWLA